MDARTPPEQSRDRGIAHVEAAGIGAEGWQDQSPRIADKAAPADMPPSPAESGLGVEMAGNLAGHGTAVGHMAEDKGAEAKFRHGSGAERRGWRRLIRSEEHTSGLPSP